jgi:hypothetical protein
LRALILIVDYYPMAEVEDKDGKKKKVIADDKELEMLGLKTL